MRAAFVYLALCLGLGALPVLALPFPAKGSSHTGFHIRPPSNNGTSTPDAGPTNTTAVAAPAPSVSVPGSVLGSGLDVYQVGSLAVGGAAALGLGAVAVQAGTRPSTPAEAGTEIQTAAPLDTPADTPVVDPTSEADIDLATDAEPAAPAEDAAAPAPAADSTAGVPDAAAVDDAIDPALAKKLSALGVGQGVDHTLFSSPTIPTAPAPVAAGPGIKLPPAGSTAPIQVEAGTSFKTLQDHYFSLGKAGADTFTDEVKPFMRTVPGFWDRETGMSVKGASALNSALLENPKLSVATVLQDVVSDVHV